MKEKIKYRSFREARKFARKLGLRKYKEWQAFCAGKLPNKGKLPDDIPKTPWMIYKNKGWVSIGDWLGTDNVATFLRQYRSFTQARKFARKLGLRKHKEWQAFCAGKMPDKGKLPDDIPVCPNLVYKDKGWSGITNWLCYGSKYRPFVRARKFAHRLKLKTWKEWQEFCAGKLPDKGKLPDDIPKNPRLVYKNKGWVSIGDWLGTGSVATFLRKYRSFTQASKYVRRLNLKNKKEWQAFCAGKLPDKGKLPDDIPAGPDKVYKNKGWVNYYDWLGTK